MPLTSVRPIPLVIALALGAALAASGARADAPQLIAEVDQNPVVAGQPFQYQVTLSIGGEEAADYRPPDFKGLKVLGAPAGPNRSTQMQLGGGGTFVQNSYTWNYTLAIDGKGPVTIGAARVKVAGREIRSNVVTIHVGAAAAPAVPVPPAPGLATPAVPGGAGARGSFIQLVTSKPRAYVGEAVSASWSLYMSQPYDRYDGIVEPRLEGFWTEDISSLAATGRRRAPARELHEGRPYYVDHLFKKALFPLQPGTLSVPALEMDLLRTDFFGAIHQREHVRSQATTLEVLPLPKTDRPAGFDPANVGTFTLAARVDRAEVNVGEAVTVTIEIKGRGNLRKITVPVLPRLEGWKAYAPREAAAVDPGDGTSGVKTAEVLLLPERPGAVTVPALAFDYFDPDAGRYARATSTPLTLSAVGEAAPGAAGGGGAGVAGAAPAAGGPGTANVIAAEIRPVHAGARLRRDIGTTFYRSRAFLGLLAAPPLALALTAVGLALRDRMAEDTEARRRKRTRRIVRARLSAAEEHRRRGETGSLFVEIDRVLREVLAARLGMPEQAIKGLRLDELAVLLTGSGMPADGAERLCTALEECDQARFAPGSVGAEAPAAALDRAGELIDLLEKAPLRRRGEVA
jgi:hypothetical protein